MTCRDYVIMLVRSERSGETFTASASLTYDAQVPGPPN